MENIYLKSRYGHEVFLKKISESRYELYGNFSLYQLVKDETGNIISVDLEGGPMISVGDHMQEGLVISKIIEDGGIILIVNALTYSPT